MPEYAGDESLPSDPSPSRVRDVLLGGRRNLQCDRDLARRLERRFPGAAAAAGEVRAFAGRAVTWCARQGIGQYIIAEPGLPLPGGAADAARAVIAGARVAWVVTDPSEAAYARAAASADDLSAAVRFADADRPGALLADPQLRAVISLDKPACAVLAGAASFLDGAAAAAMASGFAAALAPGSALIMTAWSAPCSRPPAGFSCTPPLIWGGGWAARGCTWWTRRASPTSAGGGRGCPARGCGRGGALQSPGGLP